MKRCNLFISASIAIALTSTVLLLFLRGDTSSNADKAQLGFPFEVTWEARTDNGVGFWVIGIRLPDDQLSRENLERLFRFFSRRHPDSEGRLHVNVSTNTTLSRLKADVSTQEHRRYENDAVFWREDVRRAAGGEYNEWYHYNPDPENEFERKTVVLRGTNPFGRRDVIESWETSRGNLSIRICQYELPGIEPKGVYYSFETADGIIMTVREQKATAIPREQVRWVDDQIAYVFMGCKFANTLDAGCNWSVWDAERNLSNQGNLNYDLIQEVHIQPDGFGKMKVTRQSEQLSVVELITRDFGRNWIEQ